MIGGESIVYGVLVQNHGRFGFFNQQARNFRWWCFFAMDVVEQCQGAHGGEGHRRFAIPLVFRIFNGKQLLNPLPTKQPDPLQLHTLFASGAVARGALW